MSSQPNVWQTRSRQSQSASRTPTSNRSATASPGQQTPPSQPPPTKNAANNVWTQRSASSSHERQPSSTTGSGDGETVAALNGFNAEEVKNFLGREGGAMGEVYKVGGEGAGASGKGAWGSKASAMANGQPFFVQLAKQLATLEGGG